MRSTLSEKIRTSGFGTAAAGLHNLRTILLLLLTVLSAVLFLGSYTDLIRSASRREFYSHIVFIPAICAFLMVSRRKELAAQQRYSPAAGIPLVLAGMLLYTIGSGLRAQMNENDFYSLVLFSILLFWTGGFVLVYGLRAARSAAFPLAFLLFAVPIPSTVLERIILFLQWGSTAAAHGLFALTGVPFLREGTVFTLPTVSIEVAPQCSGIRSTIALLITGVLGSKLFLQSPWRRVALVLSVFPITIFKNGIRITALTLMGAYVDVKILTKSALHSNGGVLFFALALLLLGVVLWMLRKTESGRGSPEHRVSH